MDDSKRQCVVEIWKTIVGVQQHFNDIAMKIRSLFVTMVFAVAAAQGFLLEKNLSFAVGSVVILYATFLPLLGIVASQLFYFMDRYWYHRLLLGAVLQASMIEKMYEDELPELGLGVKISEKSPVQLKHWFGRAVAAVVVSDEKYKNERQLHSDAKIELFYKSIIYLFLFLLALSVLFVGVFVSGQPLAEFLCAKISALF